MGRSPGEARRLVAAYHECAGMLPPLKRMLGTPGDRLTRDEEDRAGNDAAVIAAFDELWPLATKTKGWLEWAAEEVRSQQLHIDEADEASLEAALTEIEPLHVAARELVAAAVEPLDVVQRTALGRHMVSELDFPDHVWANAAKRQRDELAGKLRPGQAAVHSRLDWHVERQLEHFRAKHPARWLQRIGLHPEALPERGRHAIPQFRIPRKHPLKRRWMDLLQPLQAIEARGGEIAEIHQRLDSAYRHVVAERRRAQHEAEQQRRRRERAAERARRASEAEQAQRNAEKLCQRFEAFVDTWRLSSQERRDGAWKATLLRRLTHSHGIHDEEGKVVAQAVNKEKARHVLALVQLAVDHREGAGPRLRELLATEDQLCEERRRLHETMARLPVSDKARTDLADLHPHLRRAVEWLTQHTDAVVPVLAASAPIEPHVLRDALRDASRPPER